MRLRRARAGGSDRSDRGRGDAPLGYGDPRRGHVHGVDRRDPTRETKTLNIKIPNMKTTKHLTVGIEARLPLVVSETGSEKFADELFRAMLEFAEKHGLEPENLSVRVGLCGHDANSSADVRSESLRSMSKGIQSLY